MLECRKLFFLDNIFIMGFIGLDRAIGLTTYYHLQFNVLSYICVLINFLLCFSILCGLLDSNNWQTNLYIFNGSIFATSLLLLKVMAQHGYFKDRYEND